MSDEWQDLPILSNHDRSKQIGVMRGDGSFEFIVDVRITREALFEIFGGAGIMITESTIEGDEMIIRKGRVLCFSLPKLSSKEQ